MSKRALFVVISLALVLGAMDASGAGVATGTSATDPHNSFITSAHDATVISPVAGNTHTRRVLLVDALLGALVATVLGLCLLGAGRGVRDSRVLARFSIQRRGPPALCA